MENSTNDAPQNSTPQNAGPKKSNGAWICGLIGFITSLPNSLCAMLCAGVAVTAAGVAAGASASEDGNINREAFLAAQEDAAGSAAGLLWAVLLVSILCFIFSFMGKSKNSAVTGILLILGGLFILINGLVGFGSMLWGTATGALYLASGIVSIVNQKRPL